MNKLITSLLFVCIVICYISCKKTDSARTTNTATDSANILGFKDSSQLIKSIHYSGYDSTTGGVDSSSVNYLYDTLNRKITLNFIDYLYSMQSYLSSEVFTYNSAGLLIHSTSTPLQPGEDSSSVTSVDYMYDGANVIRSASIQDFYGRNYTISINKTLSPSGGYQLSWLDNSPDNLPDSNYYYVNIDSKGQLASYYDITSYSSDSIIYDASGSVSQVVETFYTTPFVFAGSNTFVLYNFLSRDTRGSQLATLNQILYNGVANIPSDIADFGNDDLGGEGSYQYSKFPALSTDINRPVSGTYCAGCSVYIVNSSMTPQYDSQNRLVKYRSFFNDVMLGYTDVSITYYK